MLAFRLDPSNPIYERVRRNFLDTLGQMLRAGPVEVRMGEPRRSLDQNDKLQAVCRDIADQVGLNLATGEYVNRSVCDGKPLSVDDWRHMLVAAYKGQRSVPGIDGGFVVLGGSSRELTKKECSEVIELAHAFGSDRNVIWRDYADEQ